MLLKNRLWLPLFMGGLMVIVACNARLDKLQTKNKTRDFSQSHCDGMFYHMGIRMDTLLTLEDSMANGESFEKMLQRYNVDRELSREIFSVVKSSLEKKEKPSRRFTAVVDGSGPGSLKYLIFRQNPSDYLVCSLGDSMFTYWYRKPVMHRERIVTGEIERSLKASLKNEGLDTKMIGSLAEIFAWNIDFSRLKDGDRYKLIVEEEVVDGAIVKVTGIKSAEFEHNGKKYYACQYQIPGQEEAFYYDANGNNLRQAFLKMPLKYGTMTSRYNLKRFHPVLNTVKPHLGTDFSAPSGTPIIATGSGTVVEAGRTTYNGNYVKIKHNNSYMTQYLHMKGFAKGIKKGSKVRQGEVIGYVGMTGLATGPHVCYRFWQNGKQVDPLKNKKASFTEPIDPAYSADYMKVFESYRTRMDARTYDYAPILHAKN